MPNSLLIGLIILGSIIQIAFSAFIIFQLHKDAQERRANILKYAQYMAKLTKAQKEDNPFDIQIK